jgi:UDP-glucuronate 4-epimerase
MNTNTPKILVTGAAGFIGYHVVKRLVALGHTVIGVDNLNDYYDVRLKEARLRELGIEEVKRDAATLQYNKEQSFGFLFGDIADDATWTLLADHNITQIIHLAAQAGVRYSLQNPKAYIHSNVTGFLNVLEFCRQHQLKPLIYASSSSVYGMDSLQPFSETAACDKPVSLYAATKRSKELMAHTYHHLYQIDNIGLRFFTVYGPWGRPDMAPWLFADAAFKKQPIKVFNHGNQSRDFTYVDDIVTGIVQIFEQREKISGAVICNIGKGTPAKLGDFITAVEQASGCILEKTYVEAQPGDVQHTFAETTLLTTRFDYTPSTNLTTGVAQFVKWFQHYHHLTPSHELD